MPVFDPQRFVKPTSYDDADKRRLELIASIEEIDVQLGNPLRKNDFPNLAAFYEWRQKTKWARAARLQHLRMVKTWMVEEDYRLNQKEA
jgi:hypothetical protein